MNAFVLLPTGLSGPSAGTPVASFWAGRGQWAGHWQVSRSTKLDEVVDAFPNLQRISLGGLGMLHRYEIKLMLYPSVFFFAPEGLVPAWCFTGDHVLFTVLGQMPPGGWA